MVEADGYAQRNGCSKEHCELRTTARDVTIKGVESRHNEQDKGEKRYESDEWMRSFLRFQWCLWFQ